MARIEEDGLVVRVYTAGPMPSHTAEDREYRQSRWRLGLAESLETIWAERPLPGRATVEFLHPDGVGCDHGGVNVAETLRQDMGMLERADVVVGYLPRAECYGAIAEIGWAAGRGRTVVVAEVCPEVVRVDDEGKPRPDWMLDLPEGDERRRSGHLCTCADHSAGTEDLGRYWFLRGLVEHEGGRVLHLESEDVKAVADATDAAIRGVAEREHRKAVALRRYGA